MDDATSKTNIHEEFSENVRKKSKRKANVSNFFAVNEILDKKSKKEKERVEGLKSKYLRRERRETNFDHKI